MTDIQGKVLVFTDLHFGLKNSAKSKLDILTKVFKYIAKYTNDNDVGTIISCGDLFHQRTNLDINVINTAYNLICELAKNCRLILICGNHDAYLKNSIDVNSINVFNSIDNVEVIKEITEININGAKSLLVPWLGDVSSIPQESFDMMFGHFDASHEYIVKSYVEDHSESKISKTLEDQINANINCNAKNAGDSIGNFVDVVKKDGAIFSGHIHGHREFLAKLRKFLMIGSPYQQNLGEKDSKNGFYVIDVDNSYSFVEIPDIPTHKQFFMSLIKDNIDNFDFSEVEDNIIQKIYDVEVDPVIDAKIMQKINDRHPYEELPPEYCVLTTEMTVELKNSIETIKKSKMDYVKNYIDNIDKKLLEEKTIDKEKLLNVLNSYYDLTILDLS